MDPCAPISRMTIHRNILISRILIQTLTMLILQGIFSFLQTLIKSCYFLIVSCYSFLFVCVCVCALSELLDAKPKYISKRGSRNFDI